MFRFLDKKRLIDWLSCLTCYELILLWRSLIFVDLFTVLWLCFKLRLDWYLRLITGSFFADVFACCSHKMRAVRGESRSVRRRRWERIYCRFVTPAASYWLVAKNPRKPLNRHTSTTIDFDEIWHDDAYWPNTADWLLKFWIFEIPRWRLPPCWKMEKLRYAKLLYWTWRAECTKTANIK